MAQWESRGLQIWRMLVRLPSVIYSLPSHGAPSVKLRILQNFTLYLRNSWSINLRAIENCICGLRSIERGTFYGQCKTSMSRLGNKPGPPRWEASTLERAIGKVYTTNNSDPLQVKHYWLENLFLDLSLNSDNHWIPEGWWALPPSGWGGAPCCPAVGSPPSPSSPSSPSLPVILGDNDQSFI